MKKIFISYSSKDIDFVRFLAETLEKHGLICWYSDTGIGAAENWAGKINEVMRGCDYFILVLSEASVASGQVFTELYGATTLNLPKIPVMLTKVALTNEFSYHLPMNAIEYYRMTDDDAFFRQLLEAMKLHPEKIDLLEKERDVTHRLYEMMQLHTDGIFSDVSEYGGYAWGINKSVIQNGNGGWLPANVIMDEVDDEAFQYADEFAEDYQAYYHSPEFQRMLRHGQNQTRWMLTKIDAYEDKLFLSVKRTEWSQTQFSWHRLMTDAARKREAIDSFFGEECTDYPNSLCLHLILIDSDNAVVATRIKKRKKNDYPSTVAITLGEQLNHSDFAAGLGDNFVLQWIRRAMYEEFSCTEAEYHKYVSEGSARVMSLDLEGDIFNFGLVCCVKLNCTCAELYEFYQLHRSADDEFDAIYPITLAEIPDILLHSESLAEQYHPSSFLRLLYAYIYTAGELPFSEA